VQSPINALIGLAGNFYSRDNSKLSKNHHPLVSVVLLSYNRPAYLQQALDSLLSQSYKNLEITVVDNQSPASAEVALIVNLHPNVKLIQNSINLGYAGGMNTGIAQADGDYVLLTEDDIILDKDCVRNLVEYLYEEPTADLISPIIYNRTEGTIRFAGGSLTLGGVFRREIYGAGERDTGQFTEPFNVGYIDGAMMFARRDFWKQFKGFREDYFMYVDAVELCTRVSKAGKSMAVVPQAKAYHFEPHHKPAPPEIEFHKVKNFFALHLLHAPARNLPEFICRYLIINGLRTLLGRNGNSRQVFLKALVWVARKTPSLLKERYAQNRALSPDPSRDDLNSIRSIPPALKPGE